MLCYGPVPPLWGGLKDIRGRGEESGEVCRCRKPPTQEWTVWWEKSDRVTTGSWWIHGVVGPPGVL